MKKSHEKFAKLAKKRGGNSFEKIQARFFVSFAKASENQVFAYQTRLPLDTNENASNILFTFARLMNTVEHSLFADIARGYLVSELKSSYLKKYRMLGVDVSSLQVVFLQ